MKAYTDLSQCKKLAEILPHESADMCYPRDAFSSNYDEEPVCHGTGGIGIALPAWSLSALLGVLSDYTLQTNTDGTVFIVCEGKKPMMSNAYNNPVDACVELILKLKERNLL